MAEAPSEAGTKGRKLPPVEHRFKKGQSGNPGGLPKGSYSVKSALLAILASDHPEKYKPKTGAQRIAHAAYMKGLDGDTKALSLILERADGKELAVTETKVTHDTVELHDRRTTGLNVGEN